MTALQLLAYICTALLMQFAAGVGVLMWRRRKTIQPPQFDERELSPTPAGAWSGWREFRVTRRDFEDASHSQCSFYLQPVDGAPLPEFRPGQYLTFSLDIGVHAAEAVGAESALKRCYSLSDRPDSASYRVTIKRMPSPSGRPFLPPGASSNHFHDRVRQGDVLKVKAPSGHFCIDLDATVPAVLVAGGIGITPLLSMLRWSVIAQPMRNIHLYYAVRSGGDHAFRHELEELAKSHPLLKLHVVYSSPEADDVHGRDYQHVGYINVDMLRGSLPHGRHQFFVCGPPLMMQSLVPALREWGVNEEDIHFEAFGPASARPAVTLINEPSDLSSPSFEVRLDRSGRTLVWDGQDISLLDFVERHGVAVDSGCRSGSCGSCETRLVSGEVIYAHEPDHDIPKGCCLLCVGKPRSALVMAL